ncbi:response regulator [Flavobacteriaceae bacterium R38]|nr:response regulator [Flavobacteriaceae bacterium R38]
MNILILEDEIPAYKKLVTYLSNYFDDNFEYHHARSVKESLKFLTATPKYDLILSDIKLLGGTCFDIFSQLKVTIPIIFCTAYDEHLLEAFQGNGIAYILKPYSQKELDEALNKYQVFFGQQVKEFKIVQEFKALFEKQELHYKKRFAIKKTRGIKLVETKDICFIEAYGNLCKLKDADGNLHTISKSIGSLLSELDPGQFFRINRSYIVNINHLEKIEPYSKNRLSIKVRGMEKPITTSTSTTKTFRAWIEQ